MSRQIIGARKDLKDPNTIKECKYFYKWNLVLQKHLQFILIEQLNSTKKTLAEVLKQRLKDEENCLKILTPFGLDQELN